VVIREDDYREILQPVQHRSDDSPYFTAFLAGKFAMFKRLNPTWQIGRIGFGDDKMLLPLQAADLVAWQTRRFYCSTEGTRLHYRRLHERKAPFRTRLTRQMLRESADAIRANVPSLRAEFGDETTDRFLSKVGLLRRR